MFTTSIDNCLFCTMDVGQFQQMRVGRLVVECGIHGQQNTNLAKLHCCRGTEAETGFAPTSAHFFAVGIFLILRFPS